MKFIFTDKSIVEMGIITDVLTEENISYKLKRFIIKDYFFDEDDEDDFMIIEEMYNIECFTDLEHFEFVKHLAATRIKNRIKLEKSFLKKAVRKKNVSQLSTENITNTNKRNKSQQKG